MTRRPAGPRRRRQRGPTGMTLVPGIEISCQRDGRSIHLLGYLVDPAQPGPRWRARSHPVGAGRPPGALGRGSRCGRHTDHVCRGAGSGTARSHPWPPAHRRRARRIRCGGPPRRGVRAVAAQRQPLLRAPLRARPGASGRAGPGRRRGRRPGPPVQPDAATRGAARAGRRARRSWVWAASRPTTPTTTSWPANAPWRSPPSSACSSRAPATTTAAARPTGSGRTPTAQSRGDVRRRDRGAASDRHTSGLASDDLAKVRRRRLRTWRGMALPSPVPTRPCSRPACHRCASGATTVPTVRRDSRPDRRSRRGRRLRRVRMSQSATPTTEGRRSTQPRGASPSARSASTRSATRASARGRPVAGRARTPARHTSSPSPTRRAGWPRPPRWPAWGRRSRRPAGGCCWSTWTPRPA